MDKYDVRELLGSGASGSVFRATRKTDGLSVAIKVIPDSQVIRHGNSSKEVFALTKAAGLPGVPRLLDHFDYDNSHVIVMDLVVGTSMLEWMRQKPSFTKIKNVYKRIASILVDLESVGVYQNDLGGSNVIISDNETVTIVDFGLASWGCLSIPEWFEGTPKEIAVLTFGELLAAALKMYYSPGTFEYIVPPNVPKDLSDLALRCIAGLATLKEAYAALSS